MRGRPCNSFKRHVPVHSAPIRRPPSLLPPPLPEKNPLTFPLLTGKNSKFPLAGLPGRQGSFVPNDISLGGSSSSSSAPFLLLSGPNMGGKSTLLRQVALAVVLAQVGPAAAGAGRG